MNSYELKLKFLATKLYVLTKKRYNLGCDIPVISFDDLQIEFQHPLACDLRNKGICYFSLDNSFNCGLVINSNLINYSLNDFIKLILLKEVFI